MTTKEANEVPQVESLVIGVSKAARAIGRERHEVYRLIEGGELEAYRDGEGFNAPWKVCVASLRRYVSRRLEQAKAKRAA